MKKSGFEEMARKKLRMHFRCRQMHWFSRQYPISDDFAAETRPNGVIRTKRHLFTVAAIVPLNCCLSFPPFNSIWERMAATEGRMAAIWRRYQNITPDELRCSWRVSAGGYKAKETVFDVIFFRKYHWFDFPLSLRWAQNHYILQKKRRCPKHCLGTKPLSLKAGMHQRAHPWYIGLWPWIYPYRGPAWPC